MHHSPIPERTCAGPRVPDTHVNVAGIDVVGATDTGVHQQPHSVVIV